MKSPFLLLAGWLALGLPCLQATPISVTVPGTANPWLAGAADGTTAASGDVAPTQSPVQVNVTAGDVLRFYVSGTTGYAGGTFISPDGDSGSYWELDHSAENGVAGIDNAPASALIGVFLDATEPVAGSEPSALDYAISSGVSAAREAASHSPGLKQPFFIGNGVGAGNGRQTITVPAGATRLFLGTMDGSGWFNNVGSFAVNITVNASGPVNSVSWSTPAAISAPTDVQTTGSLVLARNVMSAGASSNQEVTVNGVTFAEGRDITYGGVGDALFELSSGYLWGGSHGSSSTPFADLDADYKTLLNTASFRLGVVAPLRNFQLTLNSLTIGDTYHVQLWVNGSNELSGHNFGASNYRTIIATTSGSVALDPNSTNAEGGVGQWVTGTFVANEPGITFEFSAEDGGAPMLNAFQLRRESATPTITDTELPLPGNSFTVTGGTGPYAFDITAGTLPAGLSLTSDGMITGALTGSSVGGVFIRVTDSLSAVGGRLFQYSYDLGRPEIALKRVVIQDVGGTNRMAVFEVTASDDVALAPYETDALFTNASHAFECRFKIGSGAFSAWETAMYYPFSYPPAIPFDTANDLRVEFRSIDAAGTKSRTLAYDIKKGALPTTDQSFGVSVGSSTTLIPNAGTSIIKLFTEELSPGSASVKVTAVDASGKISAVYNSNRVTPANSPKTSLTLGTAITDAASGLLLPPTTGKNDGITDFVVCTEGAVKIIVNKSGAAPSLAVHSLVLPVENGTAQKVAVGDVNADGADDIIAIVHKTTGPQLGHFLVTYLNQATTNSTNGTFTTSGFAAPTSILIPLVVDARSLAAGDLNGDHAADVVFGYYSTAGASEFVGVYLGAPGGSLTAPAVPLAVTNAADDEEIVEVKIANYSGHITGHKDIIVGIVGGPDATYPTATHMAKHRVLVAQSNGTFKMAPTRRLAALSLSTADKDVFNIAVGNLSDRVVPDIVSCQFDSTSPAGTIDSGFLPPANAAGELNWMQNNDNGVQTFGISSGKPRRVALADLTGNSLPDVILANSDSGNIELQANTKPLLTAFPAKVVASPTLTVPLLTNVTPGGSPAFALRGIAGQPWKFSYAIGKPPADIVARIEYQLNNGPWTTLPGGFLGRSGSNFSTTVPSVPEGLLRFRCWATSASQTTAGVYDSYSLPSSYIRSIDAQALVVTVKAEPDSDPVGNVSTHDTEFITYRLNYTNTGTAPAANVVLAAAIPANTTWGNGGSADYITDVSDPVKVKVISWNLGTLAPGESGSKFFFAQVNSNALAVLKGKAIELKAMSAASLASPSATVALFRTTTGANKTFGIYSSAPAPGFKPQVATGSTVATTVVPPLTMTQVVSASSVTPGSIIDVEIILKNYAANTVHNIKVEDFIEPSFVVEGVRLRSTPNATTGNFDDFLDTDPFATQNPSLQFRATGRYLSWNVGSLQGVRAPNNAPQPPGECRIRYRLRVRYDVDPKQLVNDTLVARSLDYGGLTATGNPQGSTAITSARTDIMPRVSTNVAPDALLNPPKISFVQDTVPLVGTNGATATEPSNRQEMNVGGEDMAVVSEGGLMRVKLRYANTGGITALRSKITYSVPTGAEFLGFVRLDGNAVSNSNVYTLFDSKGLLIPTASYATRTKEARSMIFNLGNLAASSEGVVDFILAAYSPPYPKPINEKITPAGTVIKSVAYSMETDSLITPVAGSPAQVPVFVARPVSFNIESRPDQGEIVQTVGVPQTARFFISFRNNGWTAASNVKVQASIPVGTTLVSSQLLNPDLSGTGTVGTPRNAANAIVAANLATKVEFTIGTLPSGFQDNPAAYGYAEIVVQIASPLPANFPKDGRLKQRCEITGTDSTGKRAQGSYSLFAASSGIAAADDVKPLASSSLSEIKLIPSNARLFAGKQVPTIVRPGQLFPVIVFFGNTGDVAITNAKVAVQVPWGTDFVSAGTTPGFVKFTDKDAITGQTTPNVYRWTFPTLDGHSAKAVTMMVRVKNNAAYEGNYLFENSAVVTGTVGTTTVARVPGNARMLVLSTNPVASAWQWFGAQLQAVGGNLFGQRPAALQTAVNGITANTNFYTMAGADIMTLPNGALIIPLLGGNVVAAGGGNIVASGGGNIVASGGGNVIAAGAGNLITVTGPGLLSTANLNAAIASIVASGGGNIVASGGGNLIANDGASLIANDGASLGAVSLNLAGVVAAGGGNVVASGGGNIVASGGGNVVASGGGNVTENLTSSRPGSTLLANDGASFIQVNSLLANDGSSLLANDGASLIANDGASLIANDGASILGDQGGGLIAK